MHVEDDFGAAAFEAEGHFAQVAQGVADGLAFVAGDAEQEEAATAGAGNFAAEGTGLNGAFVELVGDAVADAAGQLAFRRPCFVEESAKAGDIAGFEQGADLPGLGGHLLQDRDAGGDVGFLFGEDGGCLAGLAGEE